MELPIFLELILIEQNMTNEDFERVKELDEMYLIEAQREEEEAYWQWEEEQIKLPAKIVIVNPIIKLEELK